MIYAAERGAGKNYRHVKAQIPYQGNTAEPLSLLYREQISQINIANKNTVMLGTLYDVVL
jgi:hypothetical protein